jgi:cell division protein FtsB
MSGMQQVDPAGATPTEGAPERTSRRARSRPRSTHETRIRRRRLVTYALALGAFVLMVNALVGERGYLATLRAKAEYEKLSASVTALKQENRRYMEQIRGLQGDPAALEDVARRELGLVRPGETLVIIRDAPATPATAPK